MQSSAAQGLHKPGSPPSDVSLLISAPEPDPRDWLSHPTQRAEDLEGSAALARAQTPRLTPHLAGSTALAGLHTPCCCTAPVQDALGNCNSGEMLQRELACGRGCRLPSQRTGILRRGGLCWKVLCPTAAFWHLCFSVDLNLWFWGPLCTKKLRSWELQGQPLIYQNPLSKPRPCPSALIQAFKQSSTSPYRMCCSADCETLG